MIHVRNNSVSLELGMNGANEVLEVVRGQLATITVGEDGR